MPYVTHLHWVSFWKFLAWVRLCISSVECCPVWGDCKSSVNCWNQSCLLISVTLEEECSETLLWKLPLNNGLVTSFIPLCLTDVSCRTIPVQIWNGKRFFLTPVHGVHYQVDCSMAVSVLFNDQWQQLLSCPCHPFCFHAPAPPEDPRWIWSVTCHHYQVMFFKEVDGRES